MAKASKQKLSRAGSYVVKAGETRPTKVVGKVNGKVTQPTTNDRRAARVLVRLKKA
jgi:hypothetical protein